MTKAYPLTFQKPADPAPPEGTRREINGQERVYYDGYWIKTYPAPVDTLDAKKRLIEALTRRLFNHTEHGLNIPGTRLAEARHTYENETDPAWRRVKAAMLAGALFNRATDIFRKLVELQGDGIEINSSDPLMRECGKCLLDAMELGRFVLHRNGDEGIDELWGEPFRAFSIPIEDFYESRYIKIGQAMRDIDRIAGTMTGIFAPIAAFSSLIPLIRDFAKAAKIKTETLRTDPSIFDVWTTLVTAGERLVYFDPQGASLSSIEQALQHGVADGLQLIRDGHDLIFDITRARTPMPKSTAEYIRRCESHRETGMAPPPSPTLPDRVSDPQS